MADNREEADPGRSERIHALDGLRTMMLSLVILYHCVLSYVIAPSQNWPFKMHLWFMYDLLFFYAAILALAPIVLRVPATWRDAALAAFGFILVRPLLRLPILALITFGMLRMVGGTLYASLSFVPNWRLLLGYGMYFGLGWLLYLKRELIPTFERFAWTHVLIALSIFFIVDPALRLGLLTGGPVSRLTAFLWSTIAGATMIWLFFFGLTGLFLRHFNRPSPTIRYVVDAAFWIYLVHLPLAIWLPGVFSTLILPAAIKILMVLAITYMVGFLSYDLFVRSTLLGSTLSGRRYPRVIFGAA